MAKKREWPKPGKFDSPRTLSNKPLTGILLEPIDGSTMLPESAGDELQDGELNRLRELALIDINKQFVLRFVALVNHYDIAETEELPLMRALTRALIRDFIPGAQINISPPAKHRKDGSYTVGGEGLFGAVNERRFEHGETISQACKYLIRHSQNRKWRGHSASALETAYHRFQRKTRYAMEALEKHPIYGAAIGIMGFESFLAGVEKLRHGADNEDVGD